MSSRDLISATNALAGVSEAGKKTAGFHNLAGSVAAMTGREGEAETHFLEVSRLEPTNAAARLNLAVVRLHSTNALVLNEARTALSHLRAEPSVRCQALRELVGDAARFNKTNDALALSQELVQQTNCLFSDHLLRLDLMRVGKPSEFKPALAVFEREAGTNVVTISELATWQLTRLGPAETLTWLRTLPRTAQTNPPVAMLVAECQGRLSDWKGLQTSLDHQDWGEMDFTRHAYETLALRGQDLRAAAQTEWELALKAANGQKQRLVMLLRFATQWKWESDSEEILRTIASQYPAEKWAFQTLFHSLFVGGRTRPMMMLLSEQMKRSPSDLVVKNNLAMTALLLEAAEFKPHDLAREIYQLDPTNYAGTYAFSLYVQGKNAEALKVMQRLKPAELEKPSNAGYYGLILKANGDRAKARAYLEWASKAQLLPEEKKLFDRAKAGI
jgi:Flp pilus assembly protein TadD